MKAWLRVTVAVVQIGSTTARSACGTNFSTLLSAARPICGAGKASAAAPSWMNLRRVGMIELLSLNRKCSTSESLSCDQDQASGMPMRGGRIRGDNQKTDGPDLVLDADHQDRGRLVVRRCL